MVISQKKKPWTNGTKLKSIHCLIVIHDLLENHELKSAVVKFGRVWNLLNLTNVLNDMIRAVIN